MANGNCRITGEPLVECLDLGNQYVSDFVAPDRIHHGQKGTLRLGVGPTSGLVQQFESLPPASMYQKYWYQSGINDSMRRELASIAKSAMSLVRLERGDTVLDIASNDGTLLSYYPEKTQRVGIDPSNVARESDVYRGNISLVNDFFSAAAFQSVTTAKAKIVTVIAMFYDLEDPLGFLRHVREVIDDRGVLVIQLSYTPLMLQQNEFGNICHEHVCYYTLNDLTSLLEQAGFEVFDAALNDANGGSIRVYATCRGSVEDLACPLHWLSIGRARVLGTLEYERREGCNTFHQFQQFAQRISDLKRTTVSWLEEQASGGKKVVGYGASTKGNVLLQYYGITPELMPCIAEANPRKWGLATIGTGIPIVSEQEMRRMKPDYLFALPWFFIRSFLDRERELVDAGTRFVLPLPQLKVIETPSDFARTAAAA